MQSVNPHEKPNRHTDTLTVVRTVDVLDKYLECIGDYACEPDVKTASVQASFAAHMALTLLKAALCRQ